METTRDSNTPAATSSPVKELINKMRDVLEDMGLPLSWFVNLDSEDDWSFVIKVHALVEAAVSSLLVYGLKNDRLSPAAHALPLANTRYGKIAFVKQLDLLSERAQMFISRLSRLRNQLVHQVQNVTFTFSVPKSEEIKNAASACVEAAIAYTQANPVEHSDFFAWARANPRSLIWFMAGILLSEIYPHKKSFDNHVFIQAFLAQVETRNMPTTDKAP